MFPTFLPSPNSFVGVKRQDHVDATRTPPRIERPDASSVIALLRPHQQWPVALLDFNAGAEPDFAELALWLFGGRIVAQRISSANLVDQLRQLHANLLSGRCHHGSARAFRILVNIPWRIVHAE